MRIHLDGARLTNAVVATATLAAGIGPGEDDLARMAKESERPACAGLSVFVSKGPP